MDQKKSNKQFVVKSLPVTTCGRDNCVIAWSADEIKGNKLLTLLIFNKRGNLS